MMSHMDSGVRRCRQGAQTPGSTDFKGGGGLWDGGVSGYNAPWGGGGLLQGD